ncbi:CBS domain protein [Agromyces ramosus]|uniref:CBS domain protein n=1 Tax=Agromyces ramosus TaxID=33879 RepID=A0A4Q7MCT2_9MICO|nr:CBS domain-containing protein [Agromyces ramosus]RZS64512.1 CBS domain protein [Agromyces ramosus]
MTVARELMTPDPTCVKEDQTLVEAARMMRDLDVGALPICGNDDRLKGMLTDRDIVVKCIADGGDPTTATAGSLAEGKPLTIGADVDIREALEVMQDQQVRRLPVIDDHRLVGIISQADIARELSAVQTGETVAEISED